MGTLDELNASLHGRYRAQRVIGRGGMATVYLATDLKHDRPVAIKILREELAAAVGHARFLREIRTTAQLAHPHILPLLDSGDADDVLYYVMPFIDGESLAARLAREGPLPLDDALSIASDVASALAYAHAHGVIHRDIKPANVMLAGGEALVMDFGLARAIQPTEEDQLSSAGLAIGTPTYMSPEQSQGEQIDARSDLYSLGVLVYEMLAGKPPFSGGSAQAVIARRLHQEVPRLREVRDVSPEIEAVVLRALARTPLDRWKSVADFATALRADRWTPGSAPTAPRTRTRATKIAGAAVVALVGMAVVAAPWLRAAGSPPKVGSTVAIPPAGMVLVPGGVYTLFGGRCANCVPSKEVHVDSFFIDRTEVTVRAFLAGDPGTHREGVDAAHASDQEPVRAVMWSEANRFCQSRDSLNRLPTEEEWEAAARGTDGRVYPWGNRWSPVSANAGSSRTGIVEVGRFPDGESPVGAVDMVGNVWEWTSTEGPRSADGHRQFVIRGGAFDTPTAIATTYYRPAIPEAASEAQRDAYYGKTGFRCVRPVRGR